MECEGARNSVRQSVRRGPLFRRRHGEGTDVGGKLGRVEASPGASPILRRQVEIPFARPMGQDAEEVAQIGLGVESVQVSRDGRTDPAGDGQSDPPFGANREMRIGRDEGVRPGRAS